MHQFISWSGKELLKSVLVFVLATYLLYQLIIGITPEHVFADNLSYNEYLNSGFWGWFSELALSLDLGNSLVQNQTVASIILANFETTLIVTLLSMLLTVMLALPFAIALTFVKKKSLTITADGLLYFFSSFPLFLLAIFCRPFWIEHFSILDWGGLFDWRTEASIFRIAGFFLLPSALLAIGDGSIAEVVKHLKNDLQQTIRESYIKIAILFDIKLYKFLGRTTTISVLQILSSRFTLLLGGAVIIEYIFFSRGVGIVALHALESKDVTVLLGVGVVFTAISLFLTFLSKLALYALDPKIRLMSGNGD